MVGSPTRLHTPFQGLDNYLGIHVPLCVVRETRVVFCQAFCEANHSDETKLEGVVFEDNENDDRERQSLIKPAQT